MPPDRSIADSHAVPPARRRPVMIRRAGKLLGGVVAVLLLASNGNELSASELPGAIAVPSGQPVSHLDTIEAAPGPEGATIRFRFLAPEIARGGGTVTPEMAQADMAHLCESFALPRLPEAGPAPAQIVISLADRPVPFGEADPEATQFFEAFGIRDHSCHWEAF